MRTFLALSLFFLFTASVYADFNVHVGTFTLNASTGSQAITGVGFTPKVVFFIGTRQTAVNTIDGNGLMSMGVMSDNGQFSIASVSDDNEASSNVKRIFKSTACLTSIGTDGTNYYTADYESMDSDGFTITITQADPSRSNIVAYYAMGGTDITNVKVSSFTVDTPSGENSVTGVGFQPDTLIVMGNAAETDNTVEDQSGLSFGIAISSTSQMTASAGGVDAQNPTVVDRYMSTTTFISYAYNSALNNEASLVSMDADGFTYDNTTAPGTAQVGWGYVALKGTFNKGIATFQSRTSLGNSLVEGFGFRPSSVMVGSIGKNTYDMGTDFVFSLGFGDDYDRQFSISTVDDDGVTPSNNGRVIRPNLFVRINDDAATYTDRARLASFEDDGFIYERLVDDGNDRYQIALAFAPEEDQDEDVKLESEVNTFTITGTGDIEVDFDTAFEPELVFIYGVSRSDEDTNSLNLLYSFGVSSGPGAEFVMSFFDDDGPTTMDANRFQSSNYVGYSHWTTARAQFSMKSMDADGFTVNVSNYNSDELFRYWALGGPAIENIWIGVIDLGNSSGNKSYTDPGFEPDCLIVHGIADETADSTQAHGIFTIGFYDGTNEFSVSGSQRDAQPTSIANRYATDQAIATQIYNDAIDYSVSMVSMDANGFTLNVDVAAFNDLLGVVAIKGPQCYVGNFADQAATGIQKIEGHSFKGKTAMFISWLGGTTFSLSSSLGYSLGTAVNSVERKALNVDVADNKAASESHRMHNSSVIMQRRSGADWPSVAAAIDFHSFHDTGFRVDVVTSDSNARSIGYIVFGDSEAQAAAASVGGANLNKVIFID